MSNLDDIFGGEFHREEVLSIVAGRVMPGVQIVARGFQLPNGKQVFSMCLRNTQGRATSFGWLGDPER